MRTYCRYTTARFKNLIFAKNNKKGPNDPLIIFKATKKARRLLNENILKGNISYLSNFSYLNTSRKSRTKARFGGGANPKP